jgi:hypothetical protein
MRALSLSGAAAVLLVPAAISLSGPTVAQPVPCAGRDEMLGRLSDEYAESVVARGLTNNGTLLEVTATADGRTWTIVLTAPEGSACLVAAGEAWQAVEPRPRGESM